MIEARQITRVFKKAMARAGRAVCFALLLFTCSCKEEMDLKRQIKQVNIDIEDSKAKLDQTAVEYRKATESMRDSTKEMAKLGPPSIAAEKVHKLEIEVQALDEKLAGGQAALEAMKKDMDDYKGKYLNH